VGWGGGVWGGYIVLNVSVCVWGGGGAVFIRIIHATDLYRLFMSRDFKLDAIYVIQNYAICTIRTVGACIHVVNVIQFICFLCLV
jgi:hypothetical protein